MKRHFFSAVLLLAVNSTAAVMAQSSIDTYDVYDVNHDTEVSVADATAVVNKVLTKEPSSEMVTAKDLSNLLQLLDSRLTSIDNRLSVLESNLPDASGVCSNGHDYIDIGLTDSQGHTLYWATCNVGAETPEDYGLYFAWGDTEGHSSNNIDGSQPDGILYNWSNAPFNNGTSVFNEGYFNSLKEEVCHDMQLALRYDAAHVNWGGGWRMPTDAELTSLVNKCIWTWDSTKKGYTVKGPNGKTIFLPAAGYRSDQYLNFAGSSCSYWSSSLYFYVEEAYYLYFNSSNHRVSSGNRYQGHVVRPVISSRD